MSKYSEVLHQAESPIRLSENTYWCDFCNAQNIVKNPSTGTRIECHSCKQTLVSRDNGRSWDRLKKDP